MPKIKTTSFREKEKEEEELFVVAESSKRDDEEDEDDREEEEEDEEQESAQAQLLADMMKMAKKKEEVQQAVRTTLSSSALDTSHLLNRLGPSSTLKKRENHVLPLPLEKTTAKKIKRAAGYENVAMEAEKWAKVVKVRREAEQLRFPLDRPDLRLKTVEKTATVEMRTPLEQEVYSLLQGAKLIKEPKETEEQQAVRKALSIQEIKERNQEMWRQKEMKRRYEQKAMLMNKSKSRKHHRILRRERLRKQRAELEELQKTDPEAALEQLQELERVRIEERMSLRHKTSKWAHLQGFRATRDKAAMAALQENQRMHKELTAKTGKPADSDEEEEEGLSGTEEEREREGVAAQDSTNPWLRNFQGVALSKRSSQEDESFTKFKKFWEEVNMRKEKDRKIEEQMEKNKQTKDREEEELAGGDNQEEEDKNGDREEGEELYEEEENNEEIQTEKEEEEEGSDKQEILEEENEKNDNVENEKEMEEEENDRSDKENSEKEMEEEKNENGMNSENDKEPEKSSKAAKDEEKTSQKDDVLNSEEGCKSGKKTKKKKKKKRKTKKEKQITCTEVETNKKDSNDEDKIDDPNETKPNKDLSEEPVSIDELFDEVEIGIKNKVQKKLQKLGVDSDRPWTEVKSKKKGKNPVSGTSTVTPAVIEEIDFTATHNETITDEKVMRTRTLEDLEALEGEEETDKLQAAIQLLKKDGVASSSTSASTGKTSDTQKAKLQVDPKKFLQVEAKRLMTALPDNVGEVGEALDDDEEEKPEDIIREAFADDYLMEEFSSEKADAIKKDQPNIMSLAMPGWGNWTGPNIQMSKRKIKKFRIKVKHTPRKDSELSNVLYNEQVDVHKNLRKAMVSDLPYPFKSVKDFEASIRAPVGRLFVTETAHKKLTAPPIITKLGTVIHPMTEEELLRYESPSGQKYKESEYSEDSSHGNKRKGGRDNSDWCNRKRRAEKTGGKNSG